MTEERFKEACELSQTIIKALGDKVSDSGIVGMAFSIIISGLFDIQETEKDLENPREFMDAMKSGTLSILTDQGWE